MGGGSRHGLCGGARAGPGPLAEWTGGRRRGLTGCRASAGSQTASLVLAAGGGVCGGGGGGLAAVQEYGRQCEWQLRAWQRDPTRCCFWVPCCWLLVELGMELLLAAMHEWAGFAATDSAGLVLEVVVCRRVIDQIHLTPVYEMSQNVPRY